MKKLKEISADVGEFEIIDEWNHQWVEDLPRVEAIAKYGECEVWSTYTAASSKLPDANGKTPSWKIAVWIEIPGMKIGGWNSYNLHLRFCGNADTAAFTGRISGLEITVTKNGFDDYEAWWHESGDGELQGYSVRGTAKQIIQEIREEWGK